MRTFGLISDALGGHGGVAKYQRDLLGARRAFTGATEVAALPRRDCHSVARFSP